MPSQYSQGYKQHKPKTPPDQILATVAELLNHPDETVKRQAMALFKVYGKWLCAQPYGVPKDEQQTSNDQFIK